MSENEQKLRKPMAYAGRRQFFRATYDADAASCCFAAAERAKRATQALAAIVLSLFVALAVSAPSFASPAFAVPLAPGGDPAQGTTTWSDFRGTPTNNAVTDAATPRMKSKANLLWATKFEDGYVSPQIIVDDAVIVTSGRGTNGVITKLDKNTGKRITDAPMHNASAYSLMPPTYADGKVFVTLSDGGLEAFDANTLKSLWYYQNPAGGQGNCPVVYSDGYVYTGYWSGETAERSFICVDASTGKLVWERSNSGGYYWAGALVVGDFLLFGCDDGQPAGAEGASKVRCVNKKTGREVSSVTVKGDQRSTIVYDEELGRVYFTTKPGLLYSARLNAQTGALSGLRSCKIDLDTTATPLVYGGRVYVGGSSGGFDKGTLSVVDAATLKMLYQLDGDSGITGTVKSAPLVSTAYADQPNGKLYLYFTINNPPGGITALEVDPGSTKASQARVFTLFTPPQDLQQYCIASVICDRDGNLYFRNDSNHLMCVGLGEADSETYTTIEGGSENGQGWYPTPQGEGAQAQPGAEPMGETRGGGTIGATSSSGGSTSDSSTSGSSSSSSSGSSSSSSSSSSTSDKSESSASSSASAGASASTASQNNSMRHTDAEAATAQLDDASEQGAPEWLVPAAVGGVALIALLAMAATRVLSARKPTPEEDSQENAVEEADASHER